MEEKENKKIEKKENEKIHKTEIKEKRKFKKKSLFIIIIIVFLIIGSVVFGKLYYDNTLKNIKNSYNKYIITKKNTKIYNKKGNEIGNISNKLTLELAKTDISNIKDKYFQIADTDYYVFYKDIKKAKKIENEEINNNYVVFNKNIKTNKKVTLTSTTGNKIVLNKGINSPILYLDKDNYYIYHLNNIFKIKKDKNIKEVDSKNTTDTTSNHVSVLFYDKIEDTCGDYNCTTTANFKEQANKIKENGYYTISTEDYKAYLNKYINLKEKAIYITTNSDNESLNNLKKELNITINKNDENTTGIKLSISNKTTTQESKVEAIDTYQIKSYSTIDNIIKMANGEEVHEQEPAPVVTTYNGGGQGIAVLNYHFFYDPELGETCDETICLTVQKFREHLEYLKNNNYKTLTMSEFRQWMYGEIELPTKSVLITIDDGAMGTGKHNGNKLIPLLEEYKMNATLFLITGWWDVSNYISPYLTIQSHTNDMHQYGSCGRGQLNCASYEEARADLQQTLNVLGNNDSFCFPFYMYSNTSLQAVKDTGFKLAFVGGSVKATRNSNKFLIPRYPIHSNITLNSFINMVN